MLYSETRDKQAQEAKQAWEKIDLPGQIAVPRKNLSALLAQQLQLQDELLRAQRDQLARAIATGGSVQQQLADPIDLRLTELAGKPEAAEKWRALRAQTAEPKGIIKNSERALRWLDFELPSCAQIDSAASTSMIQEWAQKASAAQAGILLASIESAKGACATLASISTAGVLLPGRMQQTEDALIRASDDLTRQRAQGLELRNRYRIALAEYTAAVKALNRSGDSARDKVNGAAQRLRTLAAALGRLDDVFSVKFLSEQKRDSVNILLSAVLDTPPGQPLPDNANKAAMALVVFPDLFDKAQAALADAKRPNLAPFLLQKNLEQIKADAAQRDVDAQRARIALLEAKLAAQARQADSLLLARRGLERSPYLAQTAAAALAPVKQPSDDKMRVWRATAHYLDAIGRLQSEEQKIDYRLNALASERALGYAESSVMQWGTLINTNVTQMSEFGAAGIRKEHLTALINSASLLAIGIGTNK